MSFLVLDLVQNTQSFQDEKKSMINKYGLCLLIELKKSEQSC